MYHCVLQDGSVYREYDKAMVNQKTFINSFLRKGKAELSDAAARAVQYLCITVIYQLVCFEYLRKYKALRVLARHALPPGMSYTEMQKHGLIRQIDYYATYIRSNIAGDAPANARTFQKEYGYNLYAQFLLITSRRTITFTDTEDGTGKRKRGWERKDKGAKSNAKLDLKPAAKLTGVKPDPEMLRNLEKRISKCEQRLKLLEGSDLPLDESQKSKTYVDRLVDRLKSVEDRLAVLEQIAAEKVSEDPAGKKTAETQLVVNAPEESVVKKIAGKTVLEFPSFASAGKIGRTDNELSNWGNIRRTEIGPSTHEVIVTIASSSVSGTGQRLVQPENYEQDDGSDSSQSRL